MPPALDRPLRQLCHPPRDGLRPEALDEARPARRSPRLDLGPAPANLDQRGGERLPVGVKPAVAAVERGVALRALGHVDDLAVDEP